GCRRNVSQRWPCRAGGEGRSGKDSDRVVHARGRVRRGDRSRHCRRYDRDRRHLAQADGRGDEGHAGETQGQNGRRQDAQRKGEAKTTRTPDSKARRHQPFVPESLKMKEFTWRAVLLGLAMTVVLGAANAYLGLRAGQTIAATYPAAVIGMAILRL